MEYPCLTCRRPVAPEWHDSSSDFCRYGSPLVLMLEDGGVLTDCSIRTMEPEEPLYG